MDNLIFSLNATVPIFLLMVLGFLFRRWKVIDDAFAEGMNRFVFRIALPILLFEDLASSDFFQVWDGRFVAFCFFVTLLSILISFLLSLFLKDRSMRGEFVQSAYRSSAALLGIAFIKNIYGESGMAPLMIIGSVPLYNIMAVVILALSRPGQGQMSLPLAKKTVAGILTNPLILGIAAGMLWSVSGLSQPAIMTKTISNLANTATPLGLMALGASFDWKQAGETIRPALAASFVKLILLCAIFLPIAIFLGFQKEELIAILVMLGSATTVSCFVMARNMGHSGILTSSVVAITTCASAFTLTFWLFVVKSLGLV